MEKSVRYVRAGDVKSHGDKEERNKRIVNEAKLLPSTKQLAAPGCYWFVTTEVLDDMRYDDKLFIWKGQDEAEDKNGVVHYLYRVDFKAKERGAIVLEFTDGTTVKVEGVPTRDILLKEIGATSAPDEPFDLKDLLRKLPPKNVVVINTLLLVPDEPDFVQLAETALTTIGFRKVVSSANRQYLYSHTDLINSQRHVLLIPYGDQKRYLKIEDYLPQASEALLLVDNKGEKQLHEFMAIKQVNNITVINNTNATNTWEFVLKTANFGQVELNYDKLETSVKLLLSMSQLCGMLGGVSCQNATIQEIQPLFSRFILEWSLASSDVKPLHPQEIYLCFKFEPAIVRAFMEYAAIILAALEIEYEYTPVIVNGSVLVYIRCPSYLPWYLMLRKEDIFEVLSEYQLTEIYEACISDVEASMKRPDNKEFVDELTFLKELMIEDNIAEQPKATRFAIFQTPPTIEQLFSTQIEKLESKYNSLKGFDSKVSNSLESYYNNDKLRQQLFNFKTDKNANIAVRVFLSSASAGLATNVAKLMRPYDGKSIVDGVHAGLQIANTIVEWNQSGIVYVGELKHTTATTVLFDVQDSVKFPFAEDIAQKMIKFIQKWNIYNKYSTENFNSYRFVRDFLHDTMNVSLQDRFRGPLGSYMDYVMRTGDVTPRLFSPEHGMMVFNTHKELEDAHPDLCNKLSEAELKLLKIFHRGFQLQEASKGHDVSNCCYGHTTTGLEIVDHSGKPSNH